MTNLLFSNEGYKHDAIMSRIDDEIRLACEKLGIEYYALNVGTCIGLEYVDHYTIEKNCWDALVAAYDAETASVIMSEISF